MRYYLLRDNMWLDENSGQWVFDRLKYASEKGNIEFVDPSVEYMEPCTYPIELSRDGRRVDFSFTMDSGNIPIVSEKVKLALQGMDEVDEPYKNVVMEPVRVENAEINDPYFVLIIETQIDAVDEKRSDFQKFEIDDPVRPDMAGNYRGFFNLVVDPSKIGDHHIFRLKKHLGSIIVSEEVKQRFETAGVTGAVFESVNGDRQTVT